MWSLVLLLLGIGVQDCQAECNVCSATTNSACVSETQFVFCEKSLPIQPVNSCPTGKFCTSQSVICQTSSELRECIDCGICNDLKTFACLGVRTFSLCLGVDTPSQISGSCAPDHVCNKDNPKICGNATLGSQATCPLVDDELASPNADADPNQYCRYMQRAGRYPAGNTLDTTCQQYILCYVRSGIWYGARYYCPGQTYFQSTSRLCNNSIPATCTSGVSTLQIQNLLLS